MVDPGRAPPHAQPPESMRDWNEGGRGGRGAVDCTVEEWGYSAGEEGLD